MKLRNMLLALAVLLIAGVTSTAQVTTSSMSGRVTDAMGTVIGATVRATHEPSGTTYGTVTNAEGRYNINGMRVGGPYTVQITYIGYAASVTGEIYLQLGQNYVHNVELTEESTTLGEVQVTATRTSFHTEKTGAATNINNDRIVNMPSINRSVSDIAKLSPYASGMSIAGGDGRSTNFTLDGANFNNNFGLSPSLPGGGNPVSLDAIEEIQVVVSPYDVRQSNFIGGGINAVTKSGTNTFKGSAYGYFTDSYNLSGTRINEVRVPANDELRHTYGMTFGGPIIKDKLFFFVNAEYEKRPSDQVVTWRPSENGVADPKQNLSRTKRSDMDRVKKHLIDNYGYDPGSYTDFPGDGSNIKLLARIDWNINQKNRLSFRYNYTKDQGWVPTNGNSTDAGFRNRNMNRVSQYGMVFSNSIYSNDKVVTGYSLDLNSRFSDNVSNQLLATYTTIKDMRGSNSSKFPFIDILAGRDSNGVPIIEPYISAGYELFTWNNGVNNNKWTVMDNLTFYLDTHKITTGLSYEYQMANNSYMRNGTGYYRYASVEDFINKAAPIDVTVTYGYDGEENPAAQVAFHNIGFYAQDEWDITPQFKLSYGVRADYLRYVDNLIRNNAIYDIDFEGKHIDTGVWPGARVQFSPRVGFTWDINNDKSLVLRGGTGIFQGRLPLVFFTNMPTNSGMVQGRGGAITTYNKTLSEITYQDPLLQTFAGKGMITDVDELVKHMGLPTTIKPEDGTIPYEISGVDPTFKMPQVWKSSIALDYQLPVEFPFTVTLEGIFTKTLNGVMLDNYSFKRVDDTWKRLNGSDDRYVFPDNFKIIKQNAFVLTNTDKGWGAIANITLNAEPIDNLALMAAYTFTESKELTGMPGSNAGSAYSGVVGVNGPHILSLERSAYVVPHRVIASVSYRANLNKNISQSINLFYSGQHAGTYSYVNSNDLNGDGYGSELIYIPKDRGDIKFVDKANEDAFFAFMEQDSYLKSHKGQYAGANMVLAPWLHRFDLRLAQEFKIQAGKTQNALELSFDILNIGNLLNSKWGIPKTDRTSAFNGAILKVKSIENGQPIYETSKIKGTDDFINKSFDTSYNVYNTWSMQVGLRYRFN